MRNLAEGDVFKLLIGFSIPMLLGNLFQSLYSIIDGIYVGRILGHEALAAVSISTPLIFFLMALIIGLSIAAIVLVGQAFGAKNHELLSKILVNSFLINLACSVVLSAALVLFGRGMLSLMNTPEPLMENAVTFLTWFSSGLIFIVINNWIMGVLRGLGDSRTPLYLIILSVLLNIVFIPFLIRGIGPLPPLGVRGSALATVFANMLTTFLGYWCLVRKNHFLNIGGWRWRLDIDIVKKIFAIGVPTSLQMLIVSFSGIVLMGLVNLFGSNVIAAYGIGLRMDNFAVLPAMSIGTAVSTMVAQSIGAGKRKRVSEITVSAVRLTLVIAAITIVICTFLPRQVSYLFTGEKAVIDHAVVYLRIMCWAYLDLSLFFILQSTVRGAGAMLAPLLFSIVSMTTRIALAWVLGMHTTLRETGIWIAVFISTLAGLLMMYGYYLKGRWYEKKITAGPLHPGPEDLIAIPSSSAAGTTPASPTAQ